MAELSGRKIVLGVTGGIAAYKSAELTRLLVKAGADVHVVLTEAGARFVGPVTFQALSGNPVWSDPWDTRMPNGMAHIALGRDFDALLVAPATADLMARLSQGFANDLLSTLCLARDCPLMLAPAMNRQMWLNPATQRNLHQLQQDGVAFFGPAAGEQACGEVGEGRMLEPEEILAALIARLSPKLLAGRRVLMTGGPTFEAIDPVRGITNLSSGKMAYALARAFANGGAAVTLVSGPVSLATPWGVERIDVRSAAEMHAAVMARVGRCELFAGVAAVADYTPAGVAVTKLKKGDSGLTLDLVRTPDILAEVAALPEPPFCLGFAAESENLDEYAEGKRSKKRLQLVVGNLVQHGMGTDDNLVVLYDEKGRHALPHASKDEVANAIVRHVAAMLS